jgi:hypothetical protein
MTLPCWAFSLSDDLLAALRKAKKGGSSHRLPIHFSEIQEILGHKPSMVRYFCYGGIWGELAGLGSIPI